MAPTFSKTIHGDVKKIPYVPFKAGSACIECGEVIASVPKYKLHEIWHRDDDIGVSYRCPVIACGFESTSEGGRSRVQTHIIATHNAKSQRKGVQYFINDQPSTNDEILKLRHSSSFRLAQRNWKLLQKQQIRNKKSKKTEAIPDEFVWLLGSPLTCFQM